jgi:hypothetical protein
MADPLTKGNMIVMKGDKRAAGKLNVAQGTLNNFLREDKNNKAIYVSLSTKSADQLRNTVKQENLNQLSIISANDTSDADSYLAPL